MDELINLDGMDVLLRPMWTDDAPLHQEFIARLKPDDLRFRFGSRVNEVPHSQVHRMTRVHHEREATFVAIMRAATGSCKIAGEVRVHEDIDGARAEFAIAVRSDLQRQRLGRILLQKAIAFCREPV